MAEVPILYKYMRKVAFHTLGCKVNQYETEAMKEQFAEAGYEIMGEEDVADVYVINTCTVTNLADRKSRQYIRRMKKKSPGAIVAVTGCYAQVKPEELAELEEVNIVAGTGEKNNIITYVDEYLKKMESGELSCELQTEKHILSYDELTEYHDKGIITSMDSRTRAYIKIQEGCDRFCAYCLIPYARGHVRSRDPREIVLEAKTLIEKGFKEIVLTGINAALYGEEENFSYPLLADEKNMRGIEIIIKRLNELSGDFRIRLSSLEPNVVNAEYVKRLLKYEKLCPHLHLSIQSGSDSVLKNMCRRYTRDEYLEIVKVLLDFDPHYGITTDIICGFPDESEADFLDSLRIIEEAGFLKVHPFKFSKREGTKAAKMKGQILGETKNERMERLLKAAENGAKVFFDKVKGSIRTAILEEETAEGYLTGYTDNYIKVYVKGKKEDLNCFKKVKLLEEYKDGMKGEI